jgi:hypothetical protein
MLCEQETGISCCGFFIAYILDRQSKIAAGYTTIMILNY